ncbi:MAG: hypothetical protein A2W25_05190 [candidate division Zixibacteria bacterium RBG_16_53_22]|nr:MAG: hypothetical protein A2W25_05190 [candidate division Zixibacteria bacterium RBG_16_53_22]
MSILTSAISERLAQDATLTGLLATYKGSPAVFTTDPAPGDTELPYIVTAGEVAQVPFDTKTTRGRDLMRDVRCYAKADGSAVVIETIAERVRFLLHRHKLVINGYQTIVSNCAGPIVADEKDFYGRIISVSLIAQEV